MGQANPSYQKKNLMQKNNKNKQHINEKASHDARPVRVRTRFVLKANLTKTIAKQKMEFFCLFSPYSHK